MRARTLLVLAATGLGLYAAQRRWRRSWLRCYLRRYHDGVRHPLGGFKCRDCGEAGVDLEVLGFENAGYVMPIRRVFERGREGGSSRTSAWKRTRRGGW